MTKAHWAELSNVLRPIRHKIGHFGDDLPSQSLGSELKETKPNETKLESTKQSTCREEIFKVQSFGRSYNRVWVEESLYAQNHLDISSCFGTILACDKQTDRHTTTAYTIASIALRSKRRFKYKLVKQRFAIVVQAVEDK